MADSTTLDIRLIIGRWVLEGAGQVGRLSYFVLDMIRGLGVLPDSAMIRLCALGLLYRSRRSAFGILHVPRDHVPTI